MRRRGKVLGAIHSFIKVGDESLEGQVPNRARQGWSAASWGSYTPLISIQTTSQYRHTHANDAISRYIYPNCT